jgi:hypothetical protein
MPRDTKTLLLQALNQAIESANGNIEHIALVSQEWLEAVRDAVSDLRESNHAGETETGTEAGADAEAEATAGSSSGT